MARLRRVDCSSPGISRRRAGRGFTYFDEEGRRIREREVVERIRALAIPPAWEHVWICPHPTGHLQATGTDAAGRKQYLYHAAWRARRDAQKFEDMADFARALPALRALVEDDLRATDQLTRRRVLACATRLLDRGFFRIGGEDYAARNESYGLATMRKEHVTIGPGGVMVFDYPAKHGRQRVQSVVDPLATEVVARLKRRRAGGPELLACKDRGRWRDVRSADINAYVKEATGGDFTAKDFRTWSGTVLAARALAVSGPAQGTKTSRKRAMTRAVNEVAFYLGNTPAVARASYIDPRVFDAFRAGRVIQPDLVEQGEVEAAVLDLLNERDSARVEQIAA